MPKTFPAGESQLLIDDTWIADGTKVGRVFHQARKYPDPILVADKPWERFCPVIYGTVLDAGDRLRIWYKTRTFDSVHKICYAESVDGITWEKPDLGLIEYEGSKDNNISIQHPEGIMIDGVGIIEDPEDAEWPFKAVFWQAGPKRGMCVIRSKDGLAWDWNPGLVLPDWGDRNNCMSRKDNGKYVILGRSPGLTKKYGVRIVARTESEDLVHWSEPTLILKPDTEDDAGLQFYSAVAFRYESLYLGFIERMHVCPDLLDTELIYSHDGWDWRRTRPRPRFIEWGSPRRWDDTWLFVGTNAPIRRTGQLWFYYSGRSSAHGAAYPENHGALGLALLRTDGFASMQAKEKEGWIETPPMRWPGGDLEVNVDCRRDLTQHYSTCSGELRVEVRGPSGRTLKGYSAEDCAIVRRNTASRKLGSDSHVPVFWQDGKRSMNRHQGKAVRLVFHMRDAHLYSFRARQE